MASDLPPRRAARPSGPAAGKRRRSPTKSNWTPVHIVLGVVALGLVGGVIWWFPTDAVLSGIVDNAGPGANDAATQPAAVQPLADLPEAQRRGSHHGESIVPVDADTLYHPMQRRGIDPWIQLSNPRITKQSPFRRDYTFDFQMQGLIGDGSDLFLEHRSQDSVHRFGVANSDLRMAIMRGETTGTIRVWSQFVEPAGHAGFPPNAAPDPAPAAVEFCVVRRPQGYSANVTNRTATGYVGHGGMEFKVSNSVTFGGASMTPPRAWLPEEEQLLLQPPTGQTAEIEVTLEGGRQAEPARPSNASSLSNPSPGSRLTVASPIPAGGKLPIDNLDGWQPLSFGEGRFRILAPSTTGTPISTEQSEIDGYQAMFETASLKDPRGLVMKLEWVPFPRGVPKPIREFAGGGDFRQLLEMMVANVFGKAQVSTFTRSDTRGRIQGFHSRSILLNLRLGAETAQFEIHWIMGRDFLVTVGMAYTTARPSVLDRVLESIELTGSPIHELDREQLQVADQRGFDVLSEVDVERHTIFGTWAREGAAIIGGSETSDALLYLPARFPRNYRFTVEAERVAGNGPLHLGFWVGDGPVAAVLDADPGPQMGLSLVDDKPLLQPLQHPVIGTRKVSLRVVVNDDLLTVTADGRKLFHWQGESSRLSLDRQLWNLPDYLLFLGTHQAQFRFSRMELKALE